LAGFARSVRIIAGIMPGREVFRTVVVAPGGTGVGAVAENEVQREGGEGRAIRVPAIEVLRSRAGVDYPS
jgi:hypothetical protein